MGYGRLTKKESSMFVIAPYQKGIIIGMLLSDGWLVFASSSDKNARLGFKQSLARSAYVWFVFNQVSHYGNRCTRLTSGIRKGNRYNGLEFFSRFLPCFTELHTLFYPNGKK